MLAEVPNAEERDAAWALKNSVLEAKNIRPLMVRSAVTSDEEPISQARNTIWSDIEFFPSVCRLSLYIFPT